MTVNSGYMPDSIEELLGVVDWADPKNHALDGDPDPPPHKNGQISGRTSVAQRRKKCGDCRVKMAEPSQLSFGIVNWIGPRNSE